VVVNNDHSLGQSDNAMGLCVREMAERTRLTSGSSTFALLDGTLRRDVAPRPLANRYNLRTDYDSK
jgi:hypothetical protein